METHPHSKPFDAKGFVQEARQSGESAAWQLALRIARKQSLVSVQMMTAFGAANRTLSHQALENLNMAGYLDKYSLQGYPAFYCLSSRGDKAFACQKSASFLGISVPSSVKSSRMNHTSATALVHVMLSLAFELAASLPSPFTVQKSTVLSLQDGSFLMASYTTDTAACVLFGSLVVRSETDAAQFGAALSGMNHKPVGALVFLVPDAKHGQAIGAWLCRTCGDQLSSSQIYLYDCSARQYTRCSDGRKTDTLDSLPALPDTPGAVPASPAVQTADPAASPAEVGESPVPAPSRPAPVNNPPASVAAAAAGKDPLRQEHGEIYTRMLAEGKIYCACAYLKVLSDRYLDEKSACDQLAYAVNDPMAKCSYTSENVISVYYTDEGLLNEHFLVAAALRNYFYNQCGYDYSLQRLQGIVNATDLVNRIPSLNALSYSLQHFKLTYGCGMDSFADYRQKARARFEARLAELQREAREIYDNEVKGKFAEKVQQRRFIETKKILFSTEGDLGQYLSLVLDDDRSLYELLQDFLRKTYIRDNAPIASENIDPAKVKRVITESWTVAGTHLPLQKKSSDLMGRLYNNLSKKIMRTVTVLCNYAVLLQNSAVDESNIAFIAYRRERDSVLAQISSALESIRQEKAVGRNVLQLVLCELQRRLDGSYQEEESQYFYIDFLRSDIILLDQNYLPILESVPEIEEFDILRRLVRHEQSELLSFETRLNEIFSGGDDYGSADLILHYLKEIQGRTFAEYEQMDISYADKDAQLRYKSFREDLELAQSYGQIDNTVENRDSEIARIAEYWLENAQESKNFGYYYQILDAILRKIRTDASGRERELEQTLQNYLDNNPDWKNSEEIQQAVEQVRLRIHKQNFAAAEDLLNRIQENDLHSGSELYLTDYLQEFMEEYPGIYRQTLDTGKSLRDLLPPQHNTNKDRKGGRAPD